MPFSSVLAQNYQGLNLSSLDSKVSSSVEKPKIWNGRPRMYSVRVTPLGVILPSKPPGDISLHSANVSNKTGEFETPAFVGLLVN